MFQPRSLLILMVGALVSYGIPLASRSTKSAGHTVTLSVNAAAQICRDAKLKVNSIQDSRCPSKTMCIWAGQAKVQLLLTNTEASSDVELIIGAQAKANALVTVGSKVYDVTLEDVTPYPGTGSDPSQAVVRIVCP